MCDNRRKYRSSLAAEDKALANGDDFTGLHLRRWQKVRDSHYLCYLVLKLLMVKIGIHEILRIKATDIIDVDEFTTLQSLLLALSGVMGLGFDV